MPFKSTYGNAIALDEHILRLDVKMRDVPGVAKSQRGNDLGADQSHFFRARPASSLLSSFDPVAQTSSFAVLHNQKRERGELEPFRPLHRKKINVPDDEGVSVAQLSKIFGFFFRCLDKALSRHFDPFYCDDLAGFVVFSSCNASIGIELRLEDSGESSVFLSQSFEILFRKITISYKKNAIKTQTMIVPSSKIEKTKKGSLFTQRK